MNASYLNDQSQLQNEPITISVTVSNFTKTMVCCVHMVAGAKGNIIYLSDMSVHEWKFIGTRKAETAENGIKSVHLELVIAPERLATIPHLIGYHNQYYMRFTDKTKIDRVKKEERGNQNYKCECTPFILEHIL